MKAAKLVNARHFDIIDIPTPTCGDKDVLIKIEACGVCRSELDIWRTPNLDKDYPPGFSGHEIYGEVAEVGAKVNGFAVGDKVVTAKFPGKGYAQYLLVEQSKAMKLAKSLGNEIILGESLACAINIVRSFNINSGDVVLLMGAGFMGNLILKLIRSINMNLLVVADIRESAREMAKQNGADIVLDPSQPDFQEKIKTLSNGRGADIVIEASGTQDALDKATQAIAIKGTMVVVGFHTGGKRVIDFQTWNWKCLTIINAHERDENVYMDGMRRGISILEKEKFSFDLITHRFPLRGINDAFQLMEDLPEKFIKSIILPWE